MIQYNASQLYSGSANLSRTYWKLLLAKTVHQKACQKPCLNLQKGRDELQNIFKEICVIF